MDQFYSGSVNISVMDTEEEAGAAAASLAIEAGLKALKNGRNPVFWLMAAPSGFSFYQAMIGAAVRPEVANLVRKAEWFQFDDYPIPRNSPFFPVTFRHLLATRLHEPLRDAAGGIGEIHRLELTGIESEDRRISADYGTMLNSVLKDPGKFVVQIKGTGMDGHWGFHGGETPLSAGAGMIEIPISPANRRQQMIDCPEYFTEEKDVPSRAFTCTVALFMKAHLIIDITPQSSKEYAVLGCFGDDLVHPELPSSALKEHGSAWSFLTRNSAAALMDFKASRRKDSGARLNRETLVRLNRLWDNQENPDEAEENIRIMNRILLNLGMI